MRSVRLLLRGVTAVMLGLVVILPTTTLPARADVDNADYQGYFDVLVSLFEKGMDGRYTPEEIAQLVREIIAVINGSAVDLGAYLESVQLADVRDNILYAQGFSRYMESEPIFASLYANNVAKGATHAMSRLSLDLSDEGYDAVGRAMITLFTTAEVANKATGAFGPKQVEIYKQGLNELIRKMDPACFPSGHAGLYIYNCTYLGKTVQATYTAQTDTSSIDGGPPIPGRFQESAIQDLVMKGTAEELAKKALDELTRQGH
jgi:hypothetical protein